LLLFFVAYLAGIETALTSLSTVNLKYLKKSFPKIVDYISFWETRPNELLASILVGTNLAMIGAGVAGTSIAIDLSNIYPGRAGLMFVGVPLLATLIVLAFGELIPKIYSRYNAEKVAVKGLPLLMRINWFFVPASNVLLKISERIIGVFSKNMVRETPFLKQDELKVLLLSDDTSPIPKSQRKMLNKIFDLGKTRLSHIMVPREKIQAVNIDQASKTVIEQIIQKGYSRVPVFKGDLDNIIGIIYSRDLNFALRGEALVHITDLVRPAYFVPETARVDKVLREFKSGHYHLAVVVNEFGSTVGLVTIEDIVEEIVGEIWDEYDLQEKTIFPLPDGFYAVRASETIEKVNEELKLNLVSGDFNTVGGWVLEAFGRIPKTGETLKLQDVEIQVMDATSKRVNKVKIKKIS
jgi:CBS domain containing-hemolysin-like protein